MVSVQSTLSSTRSKAVSPSAFVIAPIRGESKRVTKDKKTFHLSKWSRRLDYARYLFYF